MSRNYGSGEYRADNREFMNWRGIPRKTSGGSIISMTKRGVVIPFPDDRIVHQIPDEMVTMGRHQYRLRPGSLAARVWDLVTVIEEE